MLLLRCGERWAIRRRAGKGLLAGLWEFPNEAGALDAKEAAALIPNALHCRPCGEATHVFTHVEWHMRGFRIDCEDALPDYVWVTAAELGESYPLPTAFRFFRKQLEQDAAQESASSPKRKSLGQI